MYIFKYTYLKNYIDIDVQMGLLELSRRSTLRPCGWERGCCPTRPGQDQGLGHVRVLGLVLELAPIRFLSPFSFGLGLA